MRRILRAVRSPAAALLRLLCVLWLGCQSGWAVAAPALVHRTIHGASPVAMADRPLDAGQMEIFFDGVMASQFAQHKLAGAAILVVRGDEVLFEKGYGYADLKARVPVDPTRTRFTMGSIAKLIVWTAVMQLAEKKKLDLDADVNRYLTKFKIKDDYRRPLTLRALLTHSAGFEDMGTPFAPDIAGRYPTLGDFLAAHLPGRVMPPVINYAHASRPYSNWGPLLAAHIVENVTGRRFDLYAAQHVFQPLGMTRSLFQIAPGKGGGNRALGYSFRNGEMAGLLENMTTSGPAGALIATPDDIARFMMAHLGDGAYGGRRILATSTAALMHRQSAQASPYLNGMSLGFIESYLNGRRALRHDGSTEFNHSELMLLPESRVGVFVTLNSHDGGYARKEIIKSFLNHYFPAMIPAVEPPVNFQDRAKEYAGAYRSLRRSFTTYEKLFGSFPIHVTALPNARLLVANAQWTEVASDTFRNDAGELLGFNRDASGKVASLNLVQSIVPAERIAWYENPSAHLVAIGLCLLSAFAAIVLGLKRRRWRNEQNWWLSLAGWLIASMGALNIFAFVCLALTFSGGIWAVMSGGIPLSLYIGLSSALLSVLATVACLIVAAGIFRSKTTQATRRLYLVHTAFSVLFLFILSYWNLIGFRFG
ncbi:serine hydrolase domain-containing protein [Sphingosinicella rhizophila]|uniref:Serine hydrolase domain-containing protein n=1 Tax=Sphingosinicella rhizophila TaxID=3050082 RepID=A0ABU3Q5Z1_9SPHN|nr:serine hydrolase domain-containing protein [Sphingosinicella sp. GR2756]MDT9598489.1 serine hydrolase domain-containing protein [Sphingosinicella sp. GR2756]